MSRFFRPRLRSYVTRFSNYHRKGAKRDIVILSSPRSGSTWLMESFYTQPRLKFLNEPFYKPYLKFNKVLANPRSVYTSLTPDEELILKEYLSNDKAIKHCGPINVFDRNYNFLTTRRVLKIIKAAPLIEWFASELDFELIYLFRHPIPQSLSARRHGFSDRIRPIIEDMVFSEKYLSRDQLEFIDEICRKGTELEQYVTGWCLENLVPLSVPRSERRWTWISYEELVAKPLQCFSFLCERFELEDPDRMLARVKVPSKMAHSSPDERLSHIRNGNAQDLIRDWKNRVTEHEAGRLLGILNVFNIEAYHSGCFLPDEAERICFT